jgi:hypothetical protein
MSDVEFILLSGVAILLSWNVFQQLSIASLTKRVTEIEERLIGDK